MTRISNAFAKPKKPSHLQGRGLGEGIIPALEPSHAIAAVAKVAKTMPDDGIILANLCGRGDKDICTVAEALGVCL